MKSAKRKLITVLDNIHSIENYTDQKECNFAEICCIIDAAIEKITAKNVKYLIGVYHVAYLFESPCAFSDDRYDIHEMYGAFYRTIVEHQSNEFFSYKEFSKNLDKCHDIAVSGQTMRSIRSKLISILDDIVSITRHTDIEECDFDGFCAIVDRVIGEVAYDMMPLSNLFGVDSIRRLFTRYSIIDDAKYNTSEMFAALYHTVFEHDSEEKFSIEEFFKNLNKAHVWRLEMIPEESGQNGGLKHDAGKLKAGILADFPLALKAIAEVGTFGANKYARNSWQNVDNAIERYTDAMWRHRLSEGVDDESGLPHYYHELWNMMVIVELKEREKTTSDREHKPALSPQEEETLLFAEYLASNRGCCEDLSCSGLSGTVFEGRKCPRSNDEEFPTCTEDEVYEWAKNVIKTLRGERSC